MKTIYLMDEVKVQTNRFLKRNSVELRENNILVKKNSPFETSEFELSYEQVENKKTIEMKVNFGLLVIASLSAILGILYLLGNKIDISIWCFSFSVELF